jgi:hypothetical protein
VDRKGIATMPQPKQPLSATNQLVVRIAFLTLCIAAALAFGYYGLRHARTYARMRQQPEEITAAQAFDVPLGAGPRWVRLNEPLKLDCDHGLQQLKDGNVEFTEYLAYDETGKYAFLLQYKGDAGCARTPSVPGQALLKTPPMYWWTINNMPVPTSDPVELKIAADPADERNDAIYSFLLLLMMIGMIALLLLAQSKRPQPAQQPLQGHATASGR